MNPNCSVCWGSCQGVIGENEVLISTGTRNFKGRAGHPSSKVYLGSAATVTASAIAGEIALAEDINNERRKTSGCEADICFSAYEDSPASSSRARQRDLSL